MGEMSTIPFDHTDGKAEQKVVALNMTNVALRRCCRLLPQTGQSSGTIATFLSAYTNADMRRNGCICFHTVAYLPAVMLNIKNSVLAIELNINT